MSRRRLICVPSTAETVRGYTVIIDVCAFCSDDTIAVVLPMVRDEGRVIFASTPGGRDGVFADIFLNATPGDGIERITVRGSDIPRLPAPAECAGKTTRR